MRKQKRFKLARIRKYPAYILRGNSVTVFTATAANKFFGPTAVDTEKAKAFFAMVVE